MMHKKGLEQYKNVDLAASIQTASPHELISMLLRGATEALSKAQGAAERKDFGLRSAQINKAISIVLELRESLDTEKGGEVAENLSVLYTYMVPQLTAANRENDIDKMAEVSKLLAEVLEGWAGIPPEIRRQAD